jgi:hypothetical protein
MTGVTPRCDGCHGHQNSLLEILVRPVVIDAIFRRSRYSSSTRESPSRLACRQVRRHLLSS